MQAAKHKYIIFNKLINNFLNNNVVYHVQSSFASSRLTWINLIQLFESKDGVTKSYLKNGCHTLKMIKNDHVIVSDAFDEN